MKVSWLLRERVSRGSSSRDTLTSSPPAFPNLKFLSEVQAEKFLKLVDYEIVRERAFNLNDFYKATSNQSQLIVKRCLGLLALLRRERINLGLLSVDNITYMANTAQKAYGNICAINELCGRAGAYVYPEDENISPKAPLSASFIRRLQNMHQGEAAQNDQQETQVGNDEGFYEPQAQQQQ
ncbi:hypothetical protein KIW84_065645 [Lathyrus oleraceus]|uniref:Uncharacterized protein n=1 Tax=Pisum sativum TaxID=3888 RepID=A0A9D4WFA5_PEA|nr:hypothetical protein KIW84_065645 [Pisum sativum]